MFYCAGRNETFTFAKSIGVGLVECSMGLTQSILRDNPSELIFVGTCGAYSKDTPLLEVFSSNSAAQIELSFLEHKSYTPLDNIITLESSTPQKVVNSSNYISLNETLAQKLVLLGILYENMEFFAFLQVAKFYELPAFGIFCVTNHIHKNAQEEFLSNHSLALHKLKEYVSNLKPL